MLDGFNTLASRPGTARPLELVGGGAQSKAWAQLLATVLDVPLAMTPGNEAGAAIGAARLGWLASGGQHQEVFAQGAASPEIFTPQPATQAYLMARHARFQTLYRTLKPSFRDL